MATIQEAIKRLRYVFTSEGADKVVSDQNKVASAVVGSTTSQEKAALSLDKSFSNLERRYNTQVRAQQDYEKVQRQVNAAVAQNPALQERANAVLALAAQHYGNVSRSQQALAAVSNDLNSRLSAATGAAGSLGAVVATLGPIGIGVAAVLGGIILALKGMSDASHELAEKAQELRRFAEITGLTTAQVQALRSEAAKFGVTSDEAQTAIQNFTARFNDLRLGQGELLTQIRKVNPALADQMQMTTNAGDALTLFGQALAKVDDVFQRNALVKAATGRGGLSAAAFLQNLNVDALTKSYTEAGKGLDDGLIKKIAQLEIDIKKTSAQASQAIASIFAESTLQTELQFQKGWLDFATSVKNFSLSGDLRYLLETILKIQIGGPGTLLGSLGINYSAGYKAPVPADTFAQRFQPALDNPLKALTPANDNAAKTLEAQVADLKKLVEVLGPAATEAEKLALKQKELTLAARDAGVSAGVLARAQAGLNAEFRLNALREMVGALGPAATQAEQLALKIGELDQRLRAGAISQGTYNRAIADFKNEQSLTFLRNNITALGSAATAAQQYQLRIGELQQQLERGQISQSTFNRAVFEANPLVQELKSNFGDLAKGMVQSMLAGKSFTESLSAGLKGLSARLADKAIESLLSGDFAKAAIQGISAVITALASLFVHTNDLKGTIDTLDRLNQLRLRNIQATSDTSTLQGQLAVFNANAVLQQIEEARKGGALMGALLQVQAAERLKIESDFQKQAAELEKQAADARLARQQSLEDRIFAATNDTSTLEGALAAQQRDFAKERLDEAKNNNLDLAQLTVAQQAEELALRKSFNDKAIEETKRAEQERLDAINGTAKSVVDYLNGLVSGPSSTLSPTTTLANAQSVYSANLTLAQGGNIDAQQKFVSLADNLEKAARAVYASGQGYQDIRSQIISQGLALPAVQQATDPVVIELRNVLSAINTGNSAQLTFSQFVQGLTGNTLATIDQVTRDRLQSIFSELDGNGNGILERSEAIRAATSGVQTNTSAIPTVANNTASTNAAAQSINNVGYANSSSTTWRMKDLLTILTDTSSINASSGLQSGQAFVHTDNNIITALAKIVFNTAQTAINTSFIVGASTPAGHSAAYATGGIATPGMPIIYGEHHPQGPFLGTVGSSPIAITPAMPSFGGANDNSALLAEMKRLNDKIERLERVIAASGNQVTQAIVKTSADEVGATDENGKRVSHAIRSSSRDNKAAA